MSDSQWMVTPKSREVLGQCLLGSVLQSSHDFLTQTGVEGLGSSSLMSDGERWVSFLRGFLVHTFYAVLNCKNYIHLRFVRNANKHLTTVQVDQGERTEVPISFLRFEEIWMVKKDTWVCFLSFCPIKVLKGLKMQGPESNFTKERSISGY